MVILDQTTYLDKVLEHFQMSNVKAVKTLFLKVIIQFQIQG